MFKTYFFGNEISDYGKEHKRVDYATLAKAFDAVSVGHDFIEATGGIDAWEIDNGYSGYYEDENGNTYYSEDEIEDKVEELKEVIENLEGDLTEEEAEENDELQALKTLLEELEEVDFYAESTYLDIFQYFLISREGADILKQYTKEIVYYNANLDLYVWGVTHWGTSWSYVLTDIECTGVEAEE